MLTIILSFLVIYILNKYYMIPRLREDGSSSIWMNTIVIIFIDILILFWVAIVVVLTVPDVRELKRTEYAIIPLNECSELIISDENEYSFYYIVSLESNMSKLTIPKDVTEIKKFDKKNVCVEYKYILSDHWWNEYMVNDIFGILDEVSDQSIYHDDEYTIYLQKDL